MQSSCLYSDNQGREKEGYQYIDFTWPSFPYTLISISCSGLNSSNMKDYGKIRRITASYLDYVYCNVSISEVANILWLKKWNSWKEYRICPFHNETRASLHLFKKNFYRCFGCGMSWDVIDFVSRFYGWDRIRSIVWMKKVFKLDRNIEFEMCYWKIQKNTCRKVYKQISLLTQSDYPFCKNDEGKDDDIPFQYC